MARTYEFIIGKAEVGLRLDHYLVKHLPMAVSRSMIQRDVRAGKVTVGQRAVKTHHKLQLGDAVRAEFDELPARSSRVTLIPQPIPLDLVYEDAVLLVVNKPAGLVTHPAPGHWDGTLVNAILWHLGQGTGDGGQMSSSPVSRPTSHIPRAGIVHRLDKDTSGLLLVAKTETAHAALSKQLKARLIKRRYLALVEGHLPLDEGTVDAAIGRHLTHRKVMTIRHLGGRSAVTHYRVLRRFTTTPTTLQPSAPPAQPFPYTLLEVALETGRTHQIRVHMAHLGHPVLGDLTYGRHPASVWHALGITRQLLHAYAIRFAHPTTHAMLALHAPLPADVQHWVAGVAIPT